MATPKKGVLRPNYLRTGRTKNTEISYVVGRWRGLHNRQFFIFFPKCGQLLYSSKPARLKWVTSYICLLRTELSTLRLIWERGVLRRLYIGISMFFSGVRTLSSSYSGSPKSANLYVSSENWIEQFEIDLRTGYPTYFLRRDQYVFVRSAYVVKLILRECPKSADLSNSQNEWYSQSNYQLILRESPKSAHLSNSQK